MAMNDTLAGALNSLVNAQIVGKAICIVHPNSKMLIAVLEIMKDNHYIGEFKVIKDGRGDKVEINLIGGINKCGVIKPRFAVQKDEFDKFEKRFLPAKDFGLVIVSTSKGIMTQDQAKEKGIGGKLIAYIY